MADITNLLDIMRRLRGPDGCPWDREQCFATVAPYTIEEAYEVADAIERENLVDLKGELGDLLFQVVFHAQMAEEQEAFGFPDVVDSICSKMVRRHPHVFSTNGEHSLTAEQQTDAWQQMKAAERAGKGQASLMDDVPAGMAELQRAIKLQKRAGSVGFDWAEPGPVVEKIEEELAEVCEAMQQGCVDSIEDEIGDLLFAVANLARQLKTDPAKALRRANQKFEQRFRAMEDMTKADAAGLEDLSLEQMEVLWQRVKRTAA